MAYWSNYVKIYLRSNLDISSYLILAVGGYVAGSMNALAGFGSIITLSILMDVLGLPPNIANGTNRVNIFFNGLGALIGFHKNDKLDYQRGVPIIVITIVGAIAGILVATQIDNERFRYLFRYIIVALFFVILVNPRRWLHESPDPRNQKLWQLILIYLPIGFYGGFIQMGMGLIFLAASVLVGKFRLIESNAIKVVAIFLYTIISIAIFQYHGMIDWQAGVSLGVSTFLGGYVTAHYASRYHNASLWAYRLLVVIVLVVILRTFGWLGF